MTNNWKRIRKVYEDYQSLHTGNYINTSVTHQYPACSTCKGADKLRFRVYKNFQIYLINHWELLDTTNNINDNFKKLRNKILAYRDNVTKENQRNLCKDIEQLLKIVAFERKLTLIVDNIALLILSIAVLTGNFTIKGLIEEAYRFAYKNLLEEKNYLNLTVLKNF